MKQLFSASCPGESSTSLLYGMTNVCSKEGTGAISTWIPWGTRLLAGALALNSWRRANRRWALAGSPHARSVSPQTASSFFERRMAAWLLALALGLLAGCASQQSTPSPPRLGSGVEEYRQLTSQSASAVSEALRCLEQVSAQENRCPPKLLAAFADQVEQLQVASIRVRARAQAIRARGDAYFELWTQSRALVNENQSRPASDSFPELRESFARIKLASSQVGEAFRPFFDGLRKIRTELEIDPGVIETDKAKELIRTTREHGQQVLQRLGVLKDELQTLRQALSQAKPATNL
jgi:hypothetical protein